MGEEKKGIVEKFKSLSASKKKKIKICFYTFMAICVIIVARNEIVGLDFSKMKHLLEMYNTSKLIVICLGGVLAFLATGLYDIVVKRYEKISASWFDVITIGWLSQAFNNFVGLGGLTGGTIRNNFYRTIGVDDEKAFEISVKVWLANLLGLFALVVTALPEALMSHSLKYIIVPAVMCLYIPIYFFGGKIKIGKLDFRQTPLARMSYPEKAEMFIASLVDWAVAAIFFTIAIKMFEPRANLFLCFFVYGVSVTIGLISFIPSGLGTFDVTCLALFGAVGFNSNNILLSIFIYRFSYYLIPWLISVLIVVGKWIGRKWNGIPDGIKNMTVSALLAIGTFACGVMVILSVISPAIYIRAQIMNSVIPGPMLFTIKLGMFIIGAMLIVFSKGIASRVGRIHSITMGLLVIGSLGCIIKGMDYEEALCLAVFAAILGYNAKYFNKSSLMIELKNIAESVLLCISVPAVYLFYVHKFEDLPADPSDWHLKTYQFLLFTITVIAVSLLILFGRTAKLSLENLTEDDYEKFKEFVEKYGGNEYTHLLYLKDKNVFYNSKGDVIMLYRPSGDNIFVLGDPIGNRENFEEAIEEIVDFATEHDMIVSFYEIAGENLEVYCNQGFSFLKIGEDAMVKLADFSYVGRKNHGLRQIRNKFEKSGMTFEVVAPPFGEDFINELRVISDQWLGGRSEMCFSLGFFDEEYISKAPVAILKSEERIEAFATILPVYGSEVLSIDLMRFRSDAPAGVMDSTFISLFDWGKEQGYKYFNLGMAPMANVGNKPYSHGIDKLLSYVYDYGNKVYNFKGLRGYKEKYHPFWTNKYIVYKNNRVLPGVLIALLGVVRSGSVKNVKDV